MPASTLLDNLQAQFRSENISGTIPNKQVDLATNCFGSSENLHPTHQLFRAAGLRAWGWTLDTSYFTV